MKESKEYSNRGFIGDSLTTNHIERTLTLSHLSQALAKPAPTPTQGNGETSQAAAPQTPPSQEK
jgi:hypothetical protein